MLFDLPLHYRRALRSWLRFATALVLLALLSGVLFQESAKRLGLDEVEPGLRWGAVHRLALLHGHVMVTAVLVPIAMAPALVLARAAGGREVGPGPLAWMTRGYLPLVSLSLAMMLYKGYHVLLAVRGGERDLAAIDQRLYGGLAGLRHGLYGFAHIGMAVSLGVVAVAVWRSLRSVPEAG